MELSDTLMTIFLSVLPIAELRGALPYAYFHGATLVESYLIAVSCNALVAPILYLFLSTIHTWLEHVPLYHRFFDHTVERARHKLSEKVTKYGYLGVMIFIAIPLPITGAYTGTLGAWVLGLNRRKTMIAAVGGVMISGLIVSLIILLGVGTSSIFVKSM